MSPARGALVERIGQVPRRHPLKKHRQRLQLRNSEMEYPTDSFIHDVSQEATLTLSPALFREIQQVVLKDHSLS